MDYTSIANQKTTFEKWSKTKSHSINSKGQLVTLNLSGTNLRTFEVTEDMKYLKRLDLSKNNLTQVIFDQPMPELEFLDISYNQSVLTLVDFEAQFPQLKYLYIYDSKLQEIHIRQAMPNLDNLNLKSNQLKEINLPKGCTQLMSLALENNQLTDFTIDLQTLPALEYLNLQNNPIKKSDIRGSVEDEDNCCAFMREHQAAAREFGVALDNECKILLVGNGSVGKSCFVERLVNERFEPEWKSTHAITIEQYELQNKYKLNLWDFGGQDIYHTTHRLFMQSNSVYLLFWDWKTEHQKTTDCEESGRKRAYKNHILPYWLAYIQSQGKGSPCILIQTKKDRDGEQYAPNQSKLAAKYKSIFKKFHHIESAEADNDENGYAEVLFSIQQSVKKLKKNNEILNTHIAIRQAIRDLQKDIKGTSTDKKLLSWEDYEAIAHQHGISDNGAITPLSVLEDWLVKTGVVYYRSGLMNNQIILNQAWAIEAIYTIFDRKQHYYRFEREEGKLTGIDLQEIWSPKFEETEQNLFIDFMLSCDLCFETTPPLKEDEHRRSHSLSERTFVVPQLLPDSKPKYIKTIKEAIGRAWYYRYQHEFLHYGIIQSFIVKAQALATEQGIWKTGIYLREANNKALIQAEEKTITIQVNQQGKTLLDKIINELNDIQQNESGIIESVSIDGENYVRLNRLKSENKKNTTIRTEKGDAVPLLPLLHFLQTDKTARLVPEKREEFIPNKQTIIPEPEPKLKLTATKKQKILFLSASPKELDRVNFDVEHRTIKEKLERGKARDSFEFLPSQFALTSEELIRAFEGQPNIVHFSGHGNKGGIFITNNDNQKVKISVRALKKLFKRIKATIQLVILNNCFSAKLAEEISKLGIIVVGNNREITNPAAVCFAEGLYIGLGVGNSFDAAFDAGILALEIHHLAYADCIEVWKDGEQVIYED